MQHDSQAQQEEINQAASEPILEIQPGAEETAPAAAESLEAQVQALEARLAELQAAVMYARADTENVRKRAQEDVAAAHKYSVGKFAGELLVVKDCLEMALLDNSSVENIKMGVEMTLRNLSGAFDKFQVKEVSPAAGDKLDPNKHQAMRAEESELEPNTVVSVMQKGYVIADRVLRPAMVVVAKGK